MSHLGHPEVVHSQGDESPSGGIGPLHATVGQQPDPPSMSLLDTMMTTAQADQVGVRRGTLRPRNDMVDVALPGSDGTAGEPTTSVAGSDESTQRSTRSIRLARQLSGRIDQCPGQGMSDLHCARDGDRWQGLACWQGLVRRQSLIRCGRVSTRSGS